MVKRAYGPDKETVEKLKEEIAELASKPIPEMSFAEAEVQKVADFVNYMYQQAQFEFEKKDVKSMTANLKKVNQMFADMHAHVVKLESYIFDFKKVTQAKKAVE